MSFWNYCLIFGMKESFHEMKVAGCSSGKRAVFEAVFRRFESAPRCQGDEQMNDHKNSILNQEREMSEYSDLEIIRSIRSIRWARENRQTELTEYDSLSKYEKEAIKRGLQIEEK